MGPRVTVTERPSRPFTDLVRLQRPGLTRQNRQHVRARAVQIQSTAVGAKRSSSAAVTFGSDSRPPVHGQSVVIITRVLII